MRIAAAPPDLEAFTFLPASSPRAFWARRQLHETTIHRVDAEQAGPPVTAIDPARAADGVEEVLFGFAARPGKLVAEAPGELVLRATDTGDVWTIVVGPEGGSTASAAVTRPTERSPPRRPTSTCCCGTGVGSGT